MSTNAEAKLLGDGTFVNLSETSLASFFNKTREAVMIRSSSVVAIATTVAATLVSAQPTSAQEESDQRLGRVHFAISCNDTAQRRFDRAMRYQHSFWYRQAQEIFEDVAKVDPECGMAYWGIA